MSHWNFIAKKHSLFAIEYLFINFFFCFGFFLLFFAICNFLGLLCLNFHAKLLKITTNFLDLVLAEINRSFQPFLGCL